MQTRGNTPHGPSKTWHANGRLASEGAFESGLRQGVWTYYDERGAFVRREAYRRGALLWQTADESRAVPGDIAEEMTRRDPPAQEAPFSFAALDRFDTRSRFGLALGVHRIGPLAADNSGQVRDANGMRIEVDGQLAGGPWGVYARLVGNTVRFVESLDGASGTNSLDAGGYRMLGTSIGTVAVRAGITMPISGSNAQFLSSSLLSYERLGDIVQLD